VRLDRIPNPEVFARLVVGFAPRAERDKHLLGPIS